MMHLQLAVLAAVLCLGAFAVVGRLRFLAEEFPPGPQRATAAGLLLLALVACVFYPAATADESATIDPANLTFPALFLGHAVLTAFLVFWWGLRREASFIAWVRLTPIEPHDLRLGLATGLIGWVITMAVTSVVAGLWTLTGSAPEPETLPIVMVWLAHLSLWRKLAVIAAAMTVEEAFFRGFLQPRIGWVPSSLLFAVAHASYGLPLMVLSVFVISLAIGSAFRRTGRLLPCIVAHGVFDAIQLLVVLPMAVDAIQRHVLTGTPALVS